MSSLFRTVGIAAVAVMVSCGTGLAGTVSYGDFTGNTVEYLDVREVNADTAERFGSPISAADSLDFDPITFNSFSAGAGGADTTGSSLLLTVGALADNVIRGIRFVEAGDYELAGLGGAGTSAAVTTDITIRITEVDGGALAVPIDLVESMVLVPAGGSYDLTAAGGEPVLQGNWSGSLTVDLTQALVDASQSFSAGVTAIDVDVANVLKTTSENNTVSFISKKDFGGTSITVIIPLPPSALLGLVGIAGVLFVAHRQKQNSAVA